MPSLWWHWKLWGWGSSVVLWRSLQIVQGIATDNWLPMIFMIKFVWIIIFSHSFRFKILIDCSVFMWVGCLFFFIRKNGKSAYTSMTMIKQMWATHNFTLKAINRISVHVTLCQWISLLFLSTPITFLVCFLADVLCDLLHRGRSGCMWRCQLWKVS